MKAHILDAPIKFNRFSYYQTESIYHSYEAKILRSRIWTASYYLKEINTLLQNPTLYNSTTKLEYCPTSVLKERQAVIRINMHTDKYTCLCVEKKSQSDQIRAKTVVESILVFSEAESAQWFSGRC